MGAVYFVTYNMLIMMMLFTHFRASWTDPGYIPWMTEAPPGYKEKLTKFCKKCDRNWKPVRAHHCSECGKCIFKMDHHCPWVNNCVGAKNLKFFLLFCFYTGMGSLYTVYLMMMSFYFFMTDTSKKIKNDPMYVYAMIASIVNLILAMLFAFFTFQLISD